MVTEAQCPAVTFLNKVKGEGPRGPRIDLDNFNLRSGEVLTGLVSGFGNRTVELLLVFDNGMVENATNLLKPGTDAKTFAIGMTRQQGASGARPQILIAVASERPIAALRSAGAVSADQFFPAVLAEASLGGRTLAANAEVRLSVAVQFINLRGCRPERSGNLR